jgi:exodeoxyribonuclease III
MKIVSWNVNSVRARIDNILEYINNNNPDIILMQEIKTEDKNFPTELFKKNGYESYVFGQKSYNGVAIISKFKLTNIKTNFINDKLKQSRIITANLFYKLKNIQIINIYVPNGNPIDTEKFEYKKNWLVLFLNEIKKTIKKEKNLIIAGDFNIIPEELDVYNFKRFANDALFKIEIRKKFRELINLGFKDIYKYFNKDKNEYTFWDYMSGAWPKNNGMRIDHFLISNNLIDTIKSVNINKKPRSKVKPSDHTPIEIILN